MKVLVTSAAGFVGSQVARYYAKRGAGSTENYLRTVDVYI